MPIHDWTRVDPGIFHDFHHEWISSIKRALNSGLLPPDHYALAEQSAGGLGPDVLTLQVPDSPGGATPASGHGIALASTPPQVFHRERTELDRYATKAKAVVIHHTSDHRVVAVVEIVSPGNKSSRHGVRAFVDKAIELLQGGVHLSIVDVFPPGPRDPHGIHRVLWEELTDCTFTLPPDRRLSVAAYMGGPCPEAFVEPATVGERVPQIPLFLAPETYIWVPLEATYQTAWEAVPAYWRGVLQSATSAPSAGANGPG
jgi:hypothetical protein